MTTTNLCRVGHALLLLVGILCLSIQASPAYADNVLTTASGDAWTIYAFGNAQAVADALRAMANFAMSATFHSIVGFIAVLGILAVGVSGSFSTAIAKNFIAYCVAAMLVLYLFFGFGGSGPIVVQVEVFDSVDNTWKAPVTVPAIVGVPAAIISTAGHEITAQIEASFMMPDEFKMTNGAPFNLAASIISDASKAKITDPNLATSMAFYVQDCFTTAVARGELSATDLVTSTDFLNDIRWPSVSVMVATMVGSGAAYGQNTLTTCANAWSLINTAIAESSAGAAAFLNNASAWSNTPALNTVNTAVDAVAHWAGNSGTNDGGALVKQAAVLSTFSGAYRQQAAATGNSDFLTGLNIAQAEQTQKTGWLMSAEVFNRSMGYIYAILQIFVYAVTPLMLAAALIPGLGLALLKNFGQILLWLAVWQPMLAIVNFIVISMQQADLGGALAGAGGFGFTLANMGIVTEKTANMRAAAMFVGSMVPMLSWALVKGSMDLSHVIGAAAGERVAGAAANSMATGNYSLNQGSMDSFTANKHSLGATFDAGSGYMGGGTPGVMTNDHRQGGNVNMAMAQNPNLQTSASTALNKGGTHSSGTTGTKSATTTDSTGTSNTATDSGGWGTNASVGMTAALGTMLSAFVGGNINAQTFMPRAGSVGPGSSVAGDSVGGDGATPPKTKGGVKDELIDAGKYAASTVAKIPSAGGQLAGSASHQNTSNVSTQASTNHMASFAAMASAMQAVMSGISQMDSNSATGGWSQGRQQSATAITSLDDRLDAMREMNKPTTGYALSRMGGANSTTMQALYGKSDSPMAEAQSFAAPGAASSALAQEKSSLETATTRQARELAEREEKEKAAKNKAAGQAASIQQTGGAIAAGAGAQAAKGSVDLAGEAVKGALPKFGVTEEDMAKGKELAAAFEQGKEPDIAMPNFSK